MVLKCEINHKFYNHIQNRKKTMVSTRAQKSIQKKRKIVRWTSDEECALKFLYTNREFCIYKIGSLINRTPSSIVSKLRNLKVTNHYYEARGFNKLLEFYKEKGSIGFINKVKKDKMNASNNK